MNQPTPNSPEFAALNNNKKYRILKGREHGIPYEDLPPSLQFPVTYDHNNDSPDVTLTPKPASEIWITAKAETEALVRWQGGQATPVEVKLEKQ